MHDTLIDIIVPTNNSNAAYLKQALDSAFAQTETRWKMYIRDNCSEVDVRAIVEPYLKDPRVSFVRSDHKGSIGYNWNRNMELGSAPYVQFLFQDDWWEPWFLEKGLKAMEEFPGVGIVSLEHEYVCDAGEMSLAPHKELEAIRHSILTPGRNDGMETLRMWIRRELHPNIIGEPDFIMLRRNLMETVGPYLEDMPQNLDMEYSIRCLMKSEWYYVRENCGYFRIHPSAETSLNTKEKRGTFDRFRCFEEMIKHLPPGPDRDLALKMRRHALANMMAKFLRRVGEKSATVRGSGGFKKFAMQHPFIVAEALLKALLMSLRTRMRKLAGKA